MERRRKEIFVIVMLYLTGMDARKVSEVVKKFNGIVEGSNAASPFLSGEGSNITSAPVTLSLNEQHATLDNGIVRVNLSIPKGHVVGIEFGGLSNVLETGHKENSRGYWDIYWQTSYGSGEDWLSMKDFRIITEDENHIELSFSTQWNGDLNAIPLNLDKRFVMLRGSSGIYNYLILEHEEDFPFTSLSQIRVAFKLHMAKFNFIVISDDIQKVMPTSKDLENGQPLAYKEAILWRNLSDPMNRTAVEDKYQYSNDMKDQQVHGWFSSDDTPVGFWLIKPSTEFYSAGPFKQELTSHSGPVSLIDFLAGHYAGGNFKIELKDGELWHKVIGPYFVYLNQASNNGDPYSELWSDAKNQLEQENGKWPYDFPASKFYAKADERGSVRGRLLVKDGKCIPASFSWVGLAAPGRVGSWQTETKGYQYWVQADNDGYFIIKGVHVGVYNLYSWVPGFIGEYKLNKNITIQPGDKIKFAKMIFKPPRNKPTLWEIGIPDRTASEFFVPDPKPEYINPVFVNDEKNKFRQYGLWDRYTDLYPNEDLVYTVGISNYTTDWFYAHVPRRAGINEFEPATWQIQFTLHDVHPKDNYTLRLALAAATTSQLQISFNDNSRHNFRTSKIGFDNAIARHGIHGLYRLYSYDVPGSLLLDGMNTLYLTQLVVENPFCGVMYDYIRFEGRGS